MSATRSERLGSLLRWFDSWHGTSMATDAEEARIDWLRAVPFILIHLACFAVIWVGWSWTALSVAAGLYFVRMFAITAFYHRFFSHRTFKTSRAFQFVGAFLGSCSVQRGPLWWAAHHRLHHRDSDGDSDIHSPEKHGFLWSHVGWILSRASFRTRLEVIRDFARFPELRFLDRFDIVAPVLLAASLFGLGALLEAFAPGLGTSGPQLFVWGFLISTVTLYHLTFSINSVAHRVGSRVFPTGDQSRNNFVLSLFTLGEGWHNNHHFYPATARQGFLWWEVDVSYYLLRLLATVGLVWDLKPVPAHVLSKRLTQ